MTIHEVAKQLHQLSNGNINGEQFSIKELENLISNYFRKGVHLKLGNRFVMQIALPDGEWMMQVIRYADKADGYDYIIPDTREQEQTLIDELFS